VCKPNHEKFRNFAFLPSPILKRLNKTTNYFEETTQLCARADALLVRFTQKCFDMENIIKEQEIHDDFLLKLQKEDRKEEEEQEKEEERREREKEKEERRQQQQQQQQKEKGANKVDVTDVEDDDKEEEEEEEEGGKKTTPKGFQNPMKDTEKREEGGGAAVNSRWSDEQVLQLVETAREILESYGHENTFKKDEVWKLIKEKYEAKPGARKGNLASSLKNKYNNSYLEITKSANDVLTKNVKDGHTCFANMHGELKSGINTYEGEPRNVIAACFHTALHGSKKKQKVYKREEYAPTVNVLFDYYFENDLPWKKISAHPRRPASEIEDQIAAQRQKESDKKVEETIVLDGAGDDSMQTPAQPKAKAATTTTTTPKTKQKAKKRKQPIEEEEEEEEEQGYRNQEDELLSTVKQFIAGTAEARTTREEMKLKAMQIKQLESLKELELAKPDTDAKWRNLEKINNRLIELSGLGDLGLE